MRKVLCANYLLEAFIVQRKMMMMSSIELRWQAADADDDDDDDDDVDASSLSLRVEIAAVATVDAGTLIMIKNHRPTCVVGWAGV